MLSSLGERVLEGNPSVADRELDTCLSMETEPQP